MKLISWNVNGLRACIGKGFGDFFEAADADFFCLQETKMQQGQTDYPFTGYHQFWHSAVKKGYSGTAVFAKQEPLAVTYEMPSDVAAGEGRVITLELPEFFLVNVYTPNAQRELTRLDLRMRWEEDFRAYLQTLDAQKPVILCGDFNVAHQEIDLKNPKSNQKNAGFTPEERGQMTALLEAGFVDTFRHFYPEVTGAYSWWSYRYNVRANNVGWRIDYFLVSERLKPQLQCAAIHADILGSDHCPVSLELAW